MVGVVFVVEVVLVVVIGRFDTSNTYGEVTKSQEAKLQNAAKIVIERKKIVGGIKCRIR